MTSKGYSLNIQQYCTMQQYYYCCCVPVQQPETPDGVIKCINSPNAELRVCSMYSIQQQEPETRGEKRSVKDRKNKSTARCIDKRFAVEQVCVWSAAEKEKKMASKMGRNADEKYSSSTKTLYYYCCTAAPVLLLL